MQDKLPLWKRALRRVATGVLILLLLGVFYIAAVMGQPQGQPENAAAPAAEQPLPPPLKNALHIDSEEQLPMLCAAFPAPVMCPAYADGLTFTGGILQDTAYESGVARLATLAYRTEDGDTLTIVSIYPARALELMGRGDYRKASAGPSLAGIPSARMENDDTIRLHAQGDEALYVLTLPRSLSGAMQRWTTAMQLFTAEP